jgi:hypothetical protein
MITTVAKEFAVDALFSGKNIALNFEAYESKRLIISSDESGMNLSSKEVTWKSVIEIFKAEDRLLD